MSRVGVLVAIVILLISARTWSAVAAESQQFRLVGDGVISGGESCVTAQAKVLNSAIGEPITNDTLTSAFKLSEGQFIVQHQLLLLLPHQAPTVNPVISPTATATQTLTGTKAPDTSLWLNGSQLISLTADTTWSYTLTLAEGTNVLNVLTKDVFGNSSATITTAIVLDTTPPTQPVVTDDGGYTTNFTQLHASWTSSDPESGIEVYEYRIGTTPTGSEIVPPTSAGLATELTKTGLTLTQGQRYYIAARAKNKAGAWSEWGVSDGIYANSAVPIISSLSPADGMKFTEGDTVTLSVTASDADGDALEYQFSSRGSIKQPWSISSTYTWLTTTSDIGLQSLKAEVRDGHGGFGTREQDIYILRKPISPP